MALFGEVVSAFVKQKNILTNSVIWVLSLAYFINHALTLCFKPLIVGLPFWIIIVYIHVIYARVICIVQVLGNVRVLQVFDSPLNLRVPLLSCLSNLCILLTFASSLCWGRGR